MLCPVAHQDHGRDVDFDDRLEAIELVMCCFLGLDAAVYSAATNYLIQKQRGGPAGSNWFKNNKGGGARGPPDPSQWKYCELCKCTCAGLQVI